MSGELSWARGGPIPSRRPVPPPLHPPPAALPRGPLPEIDLALSPRAEAPSGEIPEGDVLVVAIARLECPLCQGRTRNYGKTKSGARTYHRCTSCDLRFQVVAVPMRYLQVPESLRTRLHL